MIKPPVVTVRFKDDSLKRQLEDAAHERRESLNTFCLRAIEREVRRSRITKDMIDEARKRLGTLRIELPKSVADHALPFIDSLILELTNDNT